MAWRGYVQKLFQAAAFKKASTWGTAVAVGASAGLNFKDISGIDSTVELNEIKEVDMTYKSEAYLGVHRLLDISIVTDMLFSPGALGTMIAMVFGTAGAPAGTGTDKTHTIKIAQAPSLFGTLALGMPGVIWEVPSVVPYAWTLRTAAEGIMESEIKAYGNRLVAPATVNNETSMGAITYDDVGNRLLFQNGKFYLNDQSGADFKAGDVLDINSFEFTISRPHEGIIPLGSQASLQPVQNDVVDVSVKIGFPRYNSSQDTLMAAMIGETLKKAKLEVTGAEITTGKPYKLTLYFPSLRVKPFGAKYEDIIKTEVEFLSLKASVAPTGMTETTPYLVLVNMRTTDYLA